MLALVGCSDDDSSGGISADDCEAWEQFNPVTEQCEMQRRSADDSGGQTGSDAGTSDSGGQTGDDTGTSGGDDGGATGDDTGGQTGTDTGGQTGTDGGTQECGPGDIIGTACAPSGERLSGADVTLDGYDCDGNSFTLTATTDGDGNFEFSDVPAGQHTLTISTGSFSRSQPVIVEAGSTVDLTSATSKVCLDSSSVEIAVVEGAYDHVSGILDDLQLDYTVEGDDEVALFSTDPPSGAEFLSDMNRMSQYDIIFINCGELWNRMEGLHQSQLNTMLSNLEAYVKDGNSLYVSDWSHPFIEKIFPDAVDFRGDDTVVNDPRIGYAPQTISATVASSEMQGVLGQSTAQIEFPHDGVDIINNHWVVAEGAGASSTIHLEGDAELCPSSFSSGATCSSSSGTQPAAPLLVTYEDPGSGGTVIFTSFHNERQSALNQDMERILKFLIFQL
ncbi:MAG: carboxypeptidase-like regulatory domain-containing protein [Myxococcota bacterium]